MSFNASAGSASSDNFLSSSTIGPSTSSAFADSPAPVVNTSSGCGGPYPLAPGDASVGKYALQVLVKRSNILEGSGARLGYATVAPLTGWSQLVV